MVLDAEPDNLKALLRRACANNSLHKFKLAKGDLDQVLEREPTNKRAQVTPPTYCLELLTLVSVIAATSCDTCDRSLVINQFYKHQFGDRHC